MLGQVLGHGAAQPTQNGVVFDGDDGAGIDGGLGDGLAVERFHGVHVQDASLDVRRRQKLGGVQGQADHRTTGDQGDVATLTYGDGAAQAEGLVVVVQDRDGVASIRK